MARRGGDGDVTPDRHQSVPAREHDRPDPRLDAGRWVRGPLWDELTRARPKPGGQRVGAYRILTELGRGGMSIVYLAERADGAFEPDRRYVAIGELREDLRRFQQGLPVHARTPTLRYRVSKFVRRHRASVFAGVVLLAMLAGYAATITVHARRVAAEAARTERVKDFLASLFTLANPGVTQGDVSSVAALLDAGAERVNTELGNEPHLQAELMTVLGQVYATLGRFDEAVGQLGAALAIRRRLPGASPEEVARTAFLLGNARHYQGRYAEAEALLREVVDTHGRSQEDGSQHREHDRHDDPFSAAGGPGHRTRTVGWAWRPATTMT